MKLKKSVVCALLAIAALFFLQAQSGLQVKALGSISPEEVYNFCKTLASPKFAGRYTSHEGFIAAAKWVAQKFKEWGLKPANPKEGFLQPYPCPYTMLDEAEMILLLPEKKGEDQKEVSYKEIKLETESEFMPFLFSDSGSGTADIVFAGWGISAPEQGYDDFANIDVKGKFVLLFRGSPGSDDPGLREWMSKNSPYFIKKAQEKGALGILYIYSKEPIAYTGKNFIKGFCPFLISEKVADMILQEKSTTFAQLKQELLNFKKPISFPLSSKVRYLVK